MKSPDDPMKDAICFCIQYSVFVFCNAIKNICFFHLKYTVCLKRVYIFIILQINVIFDYYEKKISDDINSRQNICS